MSRTCDYCGSDLTAYEPVAVFEGAAGERELVGEFCNYACLRQHVEDEELETGACCSL
ncbi:MAG: hypothetical protein ABEJ04_02035 [Halobacteriaceae archaeon]